MAECVDIKKAWGFNILCDWYINSIDETEPPCWTPEHIDELTDDFYVIPKRKEIAAPVIETLEWISVKDRLPDIQAENNNAKITDVVIAWGGGVCSFGYFKIYKYDDSFEFIGVDEEEPDMFCAYEDGIITHWMPLPKPPEGE